MSAEIGQLALILAFMPGLVQRAAPLLGPHCGDRVLMSLWRASAPAADGVRRPGFRGPGYGAYSDRIL